MEENKINALEALHIELSKLSPVITHLEKTVELTRLIADIPTKHVAFIKAQEEKEANFKNELLAISKEENTLLSNSFKKITSTIDGLLEDLKSSRDTSNSYETRIKELLAQIEKIDFPTRLTSIEGDVSTIASGFNNVQGAVQNLQKDINDIDKYQREKLNKIDTDLKDQSTVFTSKFEKLSKENKLLKGLVLSQILLIIFLGIGIFIK